MITAVELFVGRVMAEEGERLKPYDDKTGKTVTAPVGKVTWGWGFNLEACGSRGLFEVMARYLATAIHWQLTKFTWYVTAGDAKQSVFLDIAYNEGVAGLVNGFPHMILAAGLQNWTEVANQCRVEDASLDASRYAPLRKIILSTGTAS